MMSKRFRQAGRWLAYALALTPLLACGVAAHDGGVQGAPTPALTPQPQAQIGQSYRAGGLVVTVTGYDPHADITGVPIPEIDRAASAHFVRLDCALTNTTGKALSVEPRLQTAPYAQGDAGSTDNAPSVMNGKARVDGDFESVRYLAAGATQQRTMYFQAMPNNHLMVFYLIISPPNDDNVNHETILPPMFEVDVSE